YTWREIRHAAIEARLSPQSIEEVVDCWDVVQIWWDQIEERFGTVERLRHHVPPDDPPDNELVCARETVPMEHSRLQPYPMGQFENLQRTVSPDQGVSEPSLSNPPRNRPEMVESMFNIVRPRFENVVDRWTIIRNSLAQTVRRKMRG